MRRLLLIAAAAVAIVLVAAVLMGAGRTSTASGNTPTTTPDEVTTTGHGVVNAVPDQAGISAGVQTTGATATAALDANAATMNRVIAALKAAGGTQLQTQEVSLNPQTTPSGRITGFQTENAVSAVSAVADTGKLIDAAVHAGANTIAGPNLTVSDQDALYRQALAKAVADARAKAQALAAAGGFGVGQVLNVTEQSTETPTPFQPTATAGTAPTPVEAGTEQITADVQVGFAIN